MATARQQPQSGHRRRILRIGVLLGGKIVEERLIRERADVSLGQSAKNTFSIPIEGLPRQFVIFGVHEGRYVLNFTKNMDGRVSDGDRVMTLDVARNQGGARMVGEHWAMPLSEHARGKVSVGELTLLFQFVTEPPMQPRPMLPHSVRGTLADRLDPQLMVILAISITVHFGFMFWAVFINDPDTGGGMAERAARATFQEESYEVREDQFVLPQEPTEAPATGETKAEEPKTEQPKADKPKGDSSKPRPDAGGGRAESDAVTLQDQSKAYADMLFSEDSAGTGFSGDMEKRKPGSDLGKQLWSQQQLIVLDGWRKDCEWGTDPDAPVPGIFGPKRLPMFDRWDYATNSNDSHWANHGHQLLEGYDQIIGDEKTQRSLRTRAGLAKIERRLAGTDGHPGNKFSLALFEAITMNNAVISGEMWRDAVVTHCRTLPIQQGIPEACDVLAAWDLSDNLDSRGAVLWRRFMENVSPGAQPDLDLFTTPFDPKNPVTTPNGLNTANPRVTRALATAIADLRMSGGQGNARLRDYQIEERAGRRLPIPGGSMSTGQYNLIAQTESGWVPGKGWRNIAHASSFVAWVQYTDKGPVARSVLASSQSDNPDSPHHADQTALFSAGKSKPVLFEEAAIRADPNLKVVEICRTATGATCR
ncbi:MAG: hypothetical protein F9K40_12670 [Kofleriaceae bacterium]|nr:MAG: hypothetical protein F9K40_12670 [Kofleriaceae bacterium]